MPSVDNRVVEMRFDNKEFESGVSTSISSLEKLKKSLNLKSAADGFNEIDQASRRIDLASLGDAAEAVTSKFSILGTIGDQILRRIGDSIYDVEQKAISLAKSLSIDQVSAGWEKYADKTTAVQTIMAATAQDFSDTSEQMEFVNDQLGKLSWFTDETSYNFVDMVSNIGKFTSNGQKLDASVTSMQGIATWAAISGANAGEASRAMYNLSQALSTGAVKLIDWKSIENANMATVEFKETALETAAALGTVTKAGDGVYKTLNGTEVTVQTFNQALSEGWFSSEVLMSTLDKYGSFTNDLFEVMDKASSSMTTSKMLEFVDEFADGTLDLEAASKASGIAAEELAADLKRLGSQEYDLGRRAFRAAQEAKTFQEAIDATKDAVSSGWMETFEHIFGNYEEAKKLWTTVANEMWDVFAGGGAARNEMLAEWHEQGGYDALWQAVSNLWEGLKGIGERIGDVWHQIFPDIDTQTLLDITNAFLNFSERFKNTFATVEETVDEVVSEVAEPINEAFDGLDEKVEKYVKTLENLDRLVSEIWNGNWGNGQERYDLLESWGYSHELVQNAVEESAGLRGTFAVDQEALAKATAYLNGELADEASTLKTVDRSFKEMQLDPMADAIDDLGESASDSQTPLQNLKDVIGGFGSALGLLVDVAKLAGKYIVLPGINLAVKGFQKALAVIAPFSRAFSSFVDKLRENGTIEKNIGIIRQWVSDVVDNLQKTDSFQTFVGYWERFTTWINGLKESALEKVNSFLDHLATSEIQLPDAATIADSIATAVDWINQLIAAVEEGWPQVQAFFENLDFSDVTSFGSSIGSSISQFFTGLFSNEDLQQTGEDIFTNILEGVTNKIETTDWGNVFSLIMKGLGAAVGSTIGFGFADLLFGVGNLADSAAGVPVGVANVLNGVKDVLRGYSMDLKADALLKVAAGIGILAVSLALLSSDLVDPAKLTNAAVAISAILGVLVGLAAVIGKFWGTAGRAVGDLENTFVNIGKLQVKIKLPNMAITIAAIALGIFLLVKSFRSLAGVLSVIEPGLLWSVLGVMAGFAVVLVGLGIAFSKMGNNISIGSSLGIIAIAAGVLIMAKAMDSLTAAAAKNGDGFGSAIGAMVVILGGFTALMAVTKGVNFGNAIGVGVSFILVATGLNIMFNAMNNIADILSNGDPWAFGIALVAIAGILVAFSAVINATSGTNFGSLIGVAALFAAISAAIQYFIVPAMTELAKMSWGKMLAAAGSLGLIMIAFAVALALSSKFADTTGMLAMLEMAGAVAALSAALYVIAQVPSNDLTRAAIALGVFLAVSVGLGALIGYLQPIGTGLKILANSILLIGAGALMAGVGTLAFAKALELLSDSSINAKDAGKNLAEGIIAFFDEIMAHGQSIVEFVGLLFVAIIGVIAAKKVLAAEKTIEFVTAIVDALKNGALIASIIGVVGMLLVMLLEFLGLNVDPMITAIVAIVLKIINGISLAIIQNGSQIWAALGNLVLALGHLVLQLVQNLLNWLADTTGWGFLRTWADGLNAYMDDSTDVIVEAITQNNEELEQTITEAGNSMLSASETYASSCEQAGINMSEGLSRLNIGTNPRGAGGLLGVDSQFSGGSVDVMGLDSLTRNLTTGFSNAETAMSTGKDSLISTASGVMPELASTLTSGSSEIFDASSLTGENVILGGVDGIANNQSLLENAAFDASSSGIDFFNQGAGVNSPSTKTMATGMYMDLGLAQGIQKYANVVNSPVQSLISACLRGLNDLRSRFYNAGYYADVGLANGINAYSYTAVNAAYNLANRVSTTLKNALKISSPSKVTEEFGKFFDLGFVQGVEGYAGTVDKSVTSMSETALSGIRDVVKRINDAFDGDFDTSPVIRPVIDLTNIQNGAYAMNSMFSGYTMTPELAGVVRAASIMGGSVNVDDVNLAESFREMKNDFVHAMNENTRVMQEVKIMLANQKIYLDKDTVIGSVNEGLAMNSYRRR